LEKQTIKKFRIKLKKKVKQAFARVEAFDFEEKQYLVQGGVEQ